LCWQAWSWVEQFCWHWEGFWVVPAVVIDGTTVSPVTVPMQVLWQLEDWLLQPLRQVAEEVALAGGGTGVAGVVVSCASRSRSSALATSLVPRASPANPAKAALYKASKALLYLEWTPVMTGTSGRVRHVTRAMRWAGQFVGSTGGVRKGSVFDARAVVAQSLPQKASNALNLNTG